MNREEILSAAKACVCGGRDQDYGSPENSFELIADLWNEYVISACVDEFSSFRIKEKDVAVMMALLKIARIATGKFKADSYIDACGYMACAGELESKEGDRNAE